MLLAAALLPAWIPVAVRAGSAEAVETGAAVKVCAEFSAKPVLKGRLGTSEIDEASGLAASRAQRNVLWVHNDSGDVPRVFAVRPDGRLLGSYTLDGIEARDWEDMAAGPCPGGGECLYLGDIGDNFRIRDHIRVHRVAEPEVRKGGKAGSDRITEFVSFTLSYPDGAHNAETLLVDPVRGDVLIVTRANDGRSGVYRADLSAAGGGAGIVLQKVADLVFEDLGVRGSAIATGGDVDAAGRSVAIRTYTHAYLWSRPEGKALWEAFAGRPCRLDLVEERQGESLALTPDGKGFYTVSEGLRQPVWAYGRARR